MSTLPKWLMRHSVTVEPYTGDSAYGPMYGPPETVQCFLEEGTKLSRSADGHEATSTAQFYARPGPSVPAQSRVTLPDGRRTTVMQSFNRDGGGLPTPDHLEVHLQ